MRLALAGGQGGSSAVVGGVLGGSGVSKLGASGSIGTPSSTSSSFVLTVCQVNSR